MKSIYHQIICLLAAFIYLSLASDGVSAADPKMLQPNADTVWQVGIRHKIEWNSTYRESGRRYYSSFTRVTVQLFESESNSLLTTIVENFPFALGEFFWRVPAQITVDLGGNRTKDFQLGVDSSQKYHLLVYPTYFDWTRSCPGCKDDAPRGDDFSIIPSDCSTDDNCIALLPRVDTSAEGMPGEGKEKDFFLAVHSIGVGVGVVVALCFITAFFVYTKQGKKTWQTYRRKRSGMLYKYKPPSPESGMPSPQSGRKSAAVSPLGNFFVQNGSQRSSMVTSKESGTFYNGGTRVNNSRTTSVAFMDDIAAEAGGPSVLTHNRDSLASAVVEPVRAATLAPSRPPRPFGVADLSFVAGDEEAQMDTLSSDSESGDIVGEFDDSIEVADETSAINNSEARLVGDTFRSVLRVALKRASEDKKETLTDDNTSESGHSSTSLEKEHRKFLHHIPEDIKQELETGCSPVLSQLGCVDEGAL